MTWIIPSDREGHWNPAGLSLNPTESQTTPIM